MNDWQQRNEPMKNGKLKTYLALKTNFGLEKYLTILNNFHYIIEQFTNRKFS